MKNVAKRAARLVAKVIAFPFVVLCWAIELTVGP